MAFINDITDIFNDSVVYKLYADDVKLYTVAKSVADNFSLQGCLELLYEWSKTWQLTISNHKCCTISIGKPFVDSCPHFLGTEALTVQDRVSVLGVVVDSQLRFADNIAPATIAQKGHQRANLIHRCFTSKDRNLFVNAFITYVRPIL